MFEFMRRPEPVYELPLNVVEKADAVMQQLEHVFRHSIT
jgi:hypothetical protein